MADPERILRLRLIERLPLRTIGATVGLSGERVRQILLDLNVDAGKTARRSNGRGAQRDPDRRQLKPAQVEAIYGCDIDALRAIQGDCPLSDPTSPAHVYRSQRKHYIKRGLWAFNFPDWWSLWQKRWASRKYRSLIMVQKDHEQALGLGNAEIITRAENMRRHWKKRRLR